MGKIKVAIAEGTVYRTKDGATLVAQEEIELDDTEAAALVQAGSVRLVTPKAKKA